MTTTNAALIQDIREVIVAYDELFIYLSNSNKVVATQDDAQAFLNLVIEKLEGQQHAK